MEPTGSARLSSARSGLSSTLECIAMLFITYRQQVSGISGMGRLSSASDIPRLNPDSRWRATLADTQALATSGISRMPFS